MDQKNTIVKCTANPNCLFNHNGICDNYVITIGADGSCQEYIETESLREVVAHEMEKQVMSSPEEVGAALKSISEKMKKTCHPDCIHFDDSDMFIGPTCLFKHPEPLKEFYEGMPCEYYHALHKKPLPHWCTKEDTVIDEKLHERFKVFLSNWIKEHPPLSKEDQAIMNKIGYVPPKEEDPMCWYCDNGKHGKCKFSIRPMKDANGECCRFTSTGGNR